MTETLTLVGCHKHEDGGWCRGAPLHDPRKNQYPPQCYLCTPFCEMHIMAQLVVAPKQALLPAGALTAEELSLSPENYSRLEYQALRFTLEPSFIRLWGYGDINPRWGYWPPPQTLAELAVADPPREADSQGGESEDAKSDEAESDEAESDEAESSSN